jgi:hypothetical protein
MEIVQCFLLGEKWNTQKEGDHLESQSLSNIKFPPDQLWMYTMTMWGIGVCSHEANVQILHKWSLQDPVFQSGMITLFSHGVK